MAARWIRQYRAQPKGRLTPRIVNPDSMRLAIAEIIKDVERYEIGIKRSSIDRDTGRTQSTDITLFEADPLEITSQLDRRLVRSRRVIIVLADRTKGIAYVNLTARSWELISESQELREKLIDFNRRLIEGSRSRFMTPAYAFVVTVSPMLFFTVLSASWLLFSPTARPGTPSPHWLKQYWDIALIFWPALMVIVAMMGAVIVVSGGLKVWPESLTARSLAGAIYRIRGSFFSITNGVAIISGILIAVISSLLTIWLTRLM